MTIRDTPNLNALAAEFRFLREAEELYLRLHWYETHRVPSGSEVFPFFEPYAPTDFMSEYERLQGHYQELQGHYQELQGILYCGKGTVYDPPEWVTTPAAHTLWRRAHDFMGFDDSE